MNCLIQNLVGGFEVVVKLIFNWVPPSTWDNFICLVIIGGWLNKKNKKHKIFDLLFTLFKPLLTHRKLYFFGPFVSYWQLNGLSFSIFLTEESRIVFSYFAYMKHQILFFLSHVIRLRISRSTSAGHCSWYQSTTQFYIVGATSRIWYKHTMCCTELSAALWQPWERLLGKCNVDVAAKMGDYGIPHRLCNENENEI